MASALVTDSHPVCGKVACWCQVAGCRLRGGLELGTMRVGEWGKLRTASVANLRVTQNYRAEGVFLHAGKNYLDRKAKFLLEFSWILIFVFKFINSPLTAVAYYLKLWFISTAKVLGLSVWTCVRKRTSLRGPQQDSGSSGRFGG